MKKSQKKIQIILLIIGSFLILFTYFYYPYVKQKKLSVKKEIQEEVPVDIGKTNNNTTYFESLEYEGIYDIDKKFTVKSKKAYIDNEEPDIIYMNNMHVILYLNDGRVVNILSDEGIYNKASYDIFFKKNVRATDENTKIFSDNLDLIGNEGSVKIYNNVNITYPTGSNLSADKVEYDFEKKYFKISMFDDKRIQMKIIK